MSAGFHRSSADNARSYTGSRAFAGRHEATSMNDILGGGNANDARPPPREMTGVGGILSGSAAAEPPRPMRVQAAQAPRQSDMDELMHGVSKLDMPRRDYSQKNNRGSNMLSALRPDDSDAPEVGDPFAHMRTRPKAIGGPAQSTTQPGPPGADQDVFAALRAAHRDLSVAAAAAPRDAKGALTEYGSLLRLLQARNLPLNADSAGTLIAHLDVNGAISFDDFMEVIAEGMRSSSEPAAAPAPSSGGYQSQQPPYRGAEPPLREPPIRVTANRPTAGYQGMQTLTRPDPTNAPQLDVASLLGGRKVETAATSADLAALLNGGSRGLNQHMKRSDLAMTQGKSAQFR